MLFRSKKDQNEIDLESDECQKQEPVVSDPSEPFSPEEIEKLVNEIINEKNDSNDEEENEKTEGKSGIYRSQFCSLIEQFSKEFINNFSIDLTL